MNHRVSLASGLEIVVVQSIDFQKDVDLMQIVAEGVELQRRVFEEQGVSYPEQKVLRYEDSVGTPEEPGSLDGALPYYHLYLLKQGELIGMRATQKYRELPGLKGAVVIDYFPALVPKEEEDFYRIDQSQIFNSNMRHTESLTPVDILMMFSKHLKNGEASLKFNDGLGIDEEWLRYDDYLKSSAGIWVPPLDAETKQEYQMVLPEPVHLYGKFAGKPKLDATSARELFINIYLKDGYGVEDDSLPCVTKTLESIDSAVMETGYVEFVKF